MSQSLRQSIESLDCYFPDIDRDMSMSICNELVHAYGGIAVGYYLIRPSRRSSPDYKYYALDCIIDGIKYLPILLQVDDERVKVMGHNIYQLFPKQEFNSIEGVLEHSMYKKEISMNLLRVIRRRA